jgi:hypothetical protein
MSLKIYYRNGNVHYIRPTPFISISHTPLKNKVGSVGCTYEITLTGTIIAHDGSPYIVTEQNGNIAANTLPNFSSSYDDPSITSRNVDIGDRLKAIILKQNKLRDLFSSDGQRIEIGSWLDGEKCIVFYPKVNSINFEEGLYVDTCKYTISLEAPLLFDKNNNVYTEGLIGLTFTPNRYNLQRTKDHYLREENTQTVENIIDRWGGIVEDFTDTWSLETDESNGQTTGLNYIPISFRVTRNMSATGRQVYASGKLPNGSTGMKKYEAWEQSIGFIKKTLLHENQAPPIGGEYYYEDNESYLQYPSRLTYDGRDGYFGREFLNIPSYYKGYNHVRTINIDKSAGSCSVSETWLLASGQSHLENYTVSLSTSVDNPFTSVKIDGNIKGLSDLHASGYMPSHFDESPSTDHTPYKKAIDQYFKISNNGKFGVGSILYQRANNTSSPLVLNSQPLSISLGSNEINGEITYSLEFNDRPFNYFTGVLGENISVNDTYPGDVFAVIPVIGRKTGPILQYIQGRTEYKRNVNIELLLDYTELPYSSGRDFLMLNKPSLNEPIRTELQSLIKELSPSGEPYISGYFLNPPTETWSPKDGRYTLNLSWDYVKSI